MWDDCVDESRYYNCASCGTAIYDVARASRSIIGIEMCDNFSDFDQTYTRLAIRGWLIIVKRKTAGIAIVVRLLASMQIHDGAGGNECSMHTACRLQCIASHACEWPPMWLSVTHATCPHKICFVSNNCKDRDFYSASTLIFNDTVRLRSKVTLKSKNGISYFYFIVYCVYCPCEGRDYVFFSVKLKLRLLTLLCII